MNLLIDLPTLADKQIDVTFDDSESVIVIATALGSVSLAIASENAAGDLLWCCFHVDPASTMYILSPLFNSGVDVFGIQAQEIKESNNV